LFALAALTFTVGLGRQAITDADEAYYAEASREMLASGDWLTPRFNYADRWQKPVLYYWLTAATFALAGVSEGAARLWSALAGLALAGLTWAAARHLRASPGAAWLAGAIVATSFGYLTMARSALPDLPLTFCVTATIAAALWAADVGGAGLRWWVAAGAAAGCGFLMKGPVAVAVPAVVLVPVWWLERGGTTRPSWTGIAVATATSAVIGLPWYAAMFAAHGVPYLESFFLTDNLERFTTSRFNEPRPLWFYPAVIAGGLLPWTLYAVGPLLEAVGAAFGRRLAMSRAHWRLLLWAIAPLLLFMASVGQQPRYVLPILPPLAILLGMAIDGRVRESGRGLVAPTLATAAMLLLFAVLLLRLRPVLVTALPWAPWLAAAMMTAAAVTLAWVALSRRWPALPALMTAAAVSWLLAVQFGALAGRRPEAVENMAAAVRQHRAAGERIGPYRVFVRNLVFYTGLRQEDLFDEASAVRFLQSADRVLLVVGQDDQVRLEQLSGVTTHELARVTYLNTANLRLRSLLTPAADLLETVVLVSNK
jgi:4-amino-4-deoxy-L-arabinose transferase-like glycosyltransferase